MKLKTVWPWLCNTIMPTKPLVVRFRNVCMASLWMFCKVYINIMFSYFLSFCINSVFVRQHTHENKAQAVISIAHNSIKMWPWGQQQFLLKVVLCESPCIITINSCSSHFTANWSLRCPALVLSINSLIFKYILLSSHHQKWVLFICSWHISLFTRPILN